MLSLQLALYLYVFYSPWLHHFVLVQSVTPPQITLDPLQSKTQIVVAGDKTTLEITARGKGSLSYQWKKDGENITTDDFEGATSPKLHITAVDIQHEGLYTCVVSNEAGQVVSEQIVLSVGKLISKQKINPHFIFTYLDFVSYACTCIISHSS